MLKNTVTITVPSQCRCGKPIPEEARKTAYDDTLKKMSTWFGGCTVYRVEGGYCMETGELAREPVDVVESSASDDALEAHREDVIQYARDLAERLNQECITYTVNGERDFVGSEADAPCWHGVSLRVTPEEQRRRETLSALQGLEAALRGLFDPRKGAPADRLASLMAHALNFTYADEPLGCRFSKEEQQLLYRGQLPRVAARSEDGRFMAVLVTLKDERLLIRDQRPILERILRDHPGRSFLFCVTGADGSAWHLVNTPMLQDEGRKGRRVFRRFRLESQDQPMRTIVERLSLVKAADVARLSGSEIQVLFDRAFDVQALGEQFFRDFKKHFEALRASIAGFGDSGEEQEARHLFTQQLCNRLLFLTFVARKGWLRFPADGSGSEDYFRALWKDYEAVEKQRQPAKANFYRDRLSALFFETLCRDHESLDGEARRGLERKVGRLLYLNGGLFEKSKDDSRKGLFVPDEPLRGIIEKLLCGYNFTVTESTPFDEDVAVDPEMLGRLFERLVVGRHEKGSYYTPRNIVEFMCREALKGYLLRELKGATEEAVARFVDDGEPGRLDAQSALEALERITVCDPACGSGAYLLGMLHELFRLRGSLYASRKKDDSRDYQTKLEIISRNLYGVDLDEFAVNIARLRLWLSLMVEYAGGDTPPPLPNLDYQIERGDSLLGPNLRGQQQDLLEFALMAPQIEGYRKSKEAFLCSHGEKRDQLRKAVEQHKKRLQKLIRYAHETADFARPDGQPVFRWDLEFTEILSRGGFDVILANPPYVRQESLGTDYKALLKKRFPAVYDGKADLYCYFYARALDLLKPGGMIVFISSNSWLQSKFAQKMRNVLKQSCDFQYLLNFNNSYIFSGANISPIIFVAQLKHELGPLRKTYCLTYNQRVSENEDFMKLITQEASLLNEKSFLPSAWVLTSADWADKFDQMRRNGIPLGEYAKGKIQRGFVTGLNDAFMIDGPTRQRLIDEDPASAEIIRPLLRGRDLRKWRPAFADQWLICTVHGTDISRYPAVEKHLRQFKTRLEKRAPGNYQWFELQGGSTELLNKLSVPKILYPEIARKNIFGLDQGGELLLNDKCFMIGMSDLFLLGVLNSDCCWRYITNSCPILNTGAYQLRKPIMQDVPIPIADEKQRASVIRLVQKILEAAPGEQKRLQSQLDQIIAGLYGL